MSSHQTQALRYRGIPEIALKSGVCHESARRLMHSYAMSKAGGAGSEQKKNIVHRRELYRRKSTMASRNCSGGNLAQPRAHHN